jgi:Uma2 family endonuclease
VATTTIRLTVQDLEIIPEERVGDRHELIDGELFVTPVPVSKHQGISFNLTLALGNFARGKRLGEERTAPSGVRLHDDTLVIPDICFVAMDRLSIIGEKTIDGPLDLVVEILSPGTRRRDLTSKRELYARFGVPEYWIVDPDANTLTVLVLSEGHNQPRLHRYHGKVDSQILPGLELTLGQVFEGGS